MISVCFKNAVRLAVAAGILAGALASGAASAQSGDKTLVFIPHADLRVLDPIWTTAPITRNHGYMVYDTLLALDANYNVKPQMAEGWTVSDDQRTYKFTLRDGLKFHDGTPVRSADVIASIRRWAKNDTFGRAMMRVVSSMAAIDDKSFEIRLRQPFPLLIDALAKPGSNVPFIMPERLAKIDAGEQIKEVIGSGPFKFVPDEWIPGIKVVYAKNTDYVPRKEPPSWTSGGKVVKVDRVEWHYITDVATAHAALISGEADWWEQPPADILSVLRGSRGIRVENIDALGSVGMIRFNHLVPPFDNPKMRQALLHVINQKDYLLAIAGDAKNGKICMSYFTCGSPMANDAGAEVLKAQRDLEKAKQLIQEAGYNGERIVILSATDQPIVHSQGLVTTELLGSLGLNVELQASDWGTLLQRRVIRRPVEEGGWSMFHTWWGGTDLTDPAVNTAIRGNGEAGWFGWAKDEELEALREKWFEAPNAEEQKKIAMAMQARAFEVVPYIPTAQFALPTAYRSNITGVLDAPITVMWNVDKR